MRPGSRAGREAAGNDAGNDAGQALLLVVGLLVVALVAVVVLARFGGLALDRARARTASDAAALAGAADGEPAARRVASANGGILESFRADADGTVEVTVRVGGAKASSRAVADRVPGPGPRGDTERAPVGA